METAVKRPKGRQRKISEIINEVLPPVGLAPQEPRTMPAENEAPAELQPLDNQTMSTILPDVAIPTEHILLTRNQSSIDTFLRDGKALAELLTNVQTEYNDLGYGPLTQEELSPLVLQGDGESFVRNKAVAQAPKNFGGFTFSDAKLAEMVEIPNVSDLRHAVTSFQIRWKQIRTSTNNNIAFKDFVIVGDEVKLSDAAIARIEAFYSQYAETDAEKEIYLVLHQVADLLNQLHDKHNFLALNRRGNFAPIYHEHPISGGQKTKVWLESIKWRH